MANQCPKKRSDSTGSTSGRIVIVTTMAAARRSRLARATTPITAKTSIATTVRVRPSAPRAETENERANPSKNAASSRGKAVMADDAGAPR
jgi:hypothetical protein